LLISWEVNKAFITFKTVEEILEGSRQDVNPAGHPMSVSDLVQFDLFGLAHGHEMRGSAACSFELGVNPAAGAFQA
jgi:hypothetical protein